MRKLLKILLIFLFLIFPLGQLTRLSVGKIDFYWQDIIIGLINIIYFIIIISRRDFSFKKSFSFASPVLAKLVFLFTIIMGLSLAVNYRNLSGEQIVIGVLYLFRWTAYAGVYFTLREIGEMGESRGKMGIRNWLIGVGVVSAGLGLIQYFVYPDLRNLSYLGYDPHKFRAFGTFFDPNFLGIIMVLTIILFLKKKGSGVLGILGILVSYLTLALTYSRSSYLVYFIGMTILFYAKKAWRWWLIMIAVGIMTIILLPRPAGSIGVELQREETITARIKNWQESLIIFKEHPLLGVGIKTVRADSSLFFVLATTGILGGLSYLGILGTIWRKGNLLLKASLAAVFIHSFFNNTLFYPPVMLWLWIIVGLDLSDQGA